MMRVTSREVDVLRRLSTFRYLNSAQVEAFVFEGTAVQPASREVLIQRLLTGLRRRGLIVATPRLVGGRGGGSTRLAYSLTDAGEACIGGAEGPRRRGHPLRATSFVDHALATADVALAFYRSALGRSGHALLTWDSDRDTTALLMPSSVRPDGHLVYVTADRELEAFLEVDLGTERPAAFAAKIARYLDLYRDDSWRDRLPLWPTVLTVTPTVVRATSLRRTTETVLAAAPDGIELTRVTEFRFAAAVHLREDGGPLGAIWQVAGRLGFEPLIVDVETAPAVAVADPATA